MKFKFGSGTSQRIMPSQTLRTRVSGSVAILSLEALERSLKFANLQEI